MFLLLLVENLPIPYSPVTVIHVFNFFLALGGVYGYGEGNTRVPLNAVVYEAY